MTTCVLVYEDGPPPARSTTRPVVRASSPGMLLPIFACARFACFSLAVRP
jgi:hypothetical protein